MQLGMVGLGRMGANMVRRLVKGGHQCVVYNRSPQAVNELVKEIAVAGAGSPAELVKKLAKPRNIWLMVPAAVVDRTIAELLPVLEAGDTLIDGGNSYYVDDIRRAKELAPKGIHYVDVGTSGGVWGLERGYCMMIGGEKDVVQRLDSIFATLAPGSGRYSTHAGTRETRRNRRRWLSPLRFEWRRPLRQDGSQRHRIRHHGRLRGGAGRFEIRERGQGSKPSRTPRRRPCAIPSTINTTSTLQMSPKSGEEAA